MSNFQCETCGAVWLDLGVGRGYRVTRPGPGDASLPPDRPDSIVHRSSLIVIGLFVAFISGLAIGATILARTFGL